MADVAGLQRQLASARAAQAEAEAESARIRAECDERVAAARASDKPCSEAHIARDRAADALAQATQYYDAVRVRADVAVLPGVHAALRNLAANVARLVLRCLEALPELDIATDRAMLDRELGRISA